jgi:4-carboxymuconolactone decarboxylase
MKRSSTPGPNKLPGRYVQFAKDFPEAFAAYETLGNATAEAGPLDAKTRALAKLGIAVGSQLEGAIHSHTRRAVEAGCTGAEIRHVILLATTTLGFPSMMKALSCAEDVLEKA